MAQNNQLPKLIFGAAAAWAILRSATGAYKHQVQVEVMEYRNKMYDVGPNCEITLKEGVEEGGDASEDLEELWVEFVYPIVKECWAKGKVDIVDLTAAVMDQLFPEKQCVWPPKEESPKTQVMAFELMMVFVANELACEPDEELPEDQECVSVEVDDDMATTLSRGGVMLGMMAKEFGGVKGLKEEDGAYRLYHRAPKEG